MYYNICTLLANSSCVCVRSRKRIWHLQERKRCHNDFTLYRTNNSLLNTRIILFTRIRSDDVCDSVFSSSSTPSHDIGLRTVTVYHPYTVIITVPIGPQILSYPEVSDRGMVGIYISILLHPQSRHSFTHSPCCIRVIASSASLCLRLVPSYCRTNPQLVLFLLFLICSIMTDTYDLKFFLYFLS